MIYGGNRHLKPTVADKANERYRYTDEVRVNLSTYHVFGNQNAAFDAFYTKTQ